MVAITGRGCCWYRKAHSKADQLFARQVANAFNVLSRIQAREDSPVLIHLRLELVDKPAIASQGNRSAQAGRNDTYFLDGTTRCVGFE